MGKHESKGTCELCLRADTVLTEHHLTPREMGGHFMPTAMICIPCHKQIHALYTNEELAIRLYTIEALQQDGKFSKFLRYIRKQPATKLSAVRKSNERKRQKR